MTRVHVFSFYQSCSCRDNSVSPRLKLETGVTYLEELSLYVDALAHQSSLMARTFAEMPLSILKLQLNRNIVSICTKYSVKNMYVIYVYACMYVCMYVCMYMRMYVGMYVWRYVCMCVCVCESPDLAMDRSP